MRLIDPCESGWPCSIKNRLRHQKLPKAEKEGNILKKNTYNNRNTQSFLQIRKCRNFSKITLYVTRGMQIFSRGYDVKLYRDVTKTIFFHFQFHTNFFTNKFPLDL